MKPAASGPLDSHDALAIAALVKKGELSPLDLVEETIGRIEKYNPHLNAVVTKMFDVAEAAIEAGLPEGPFTGVPFLLKDLGATYPGIRHTSGSRALNRFIPEEESEIVRRLRNAGLVIMGKTNTPEFGLSPVTEPALFGPCRNPWNLQHSPGGSSGGSAAAVSSRIVPCAHANDGGGSIRIPASCCGIFGLKPTRARHSFAPGPGDVSSGLAVEHAVTLSVRDSAALLDVISGYVPGDPYAAPPPERPFLEETRRRPASLRIAFSHDTASGMPVDPDCKRALSDAVDLLGELGHEVEPATLDFIGPEFMESFITAWAAGTALTFRQIYPDGRVQEEAHEPLTLFWLERGRRVGAAEYLAAVALMQKVSRRMAEFHRNYDLFLSPTLGAPPPEIGEIIPSGDLSASEGEKILERIRGFVPFTPLANATGQPAMSVPLFWNTGGLPIGVHFLAPFGDEGTLFRLAAQLEKARPWVDRRPPILP